MWWALKMIPSQSWKLVLIHQYWVFLIMGAWIFNQIFCSLRLRILLTMFSYEVAFTTCLRVTFMTFFLSSIMPGIIVGDSSKVALLRLAHRESGLVKLALISLIDRALGVVALWLVAFTMTFFVTLPKTAPAHTLTWFVRVGFVFIMVAAAIGILLVRAFTFCNPAQHTFRKNELLQQTREILQALSSKIFARAIVQKAIPISVIAVVGLVLAQATIGTRILTALGQDPHFALQTMLAPASLIAAALPISPSGLGVSQLTLAAAYQLANLSAQAAVLLTTIMQLGQIAVGMTLGVYAFLTLLQKSKISMHKQSD